jgi:hypothetical protein
MPGNHWGVDSFVRADTPSKDGTQTLYDLVVNKAKEMHAPLEKPEFWGRYIGGDNHNPRRGEQNGYLTLDEISFLGKRDCRILLIRRGLADAVKRDSVHAGRQSAVAAQQVAVQTHGITPQHTWIYADIEPDYRIVSSRWMQGWMRQMHESSWGGAGGFYAPTGVNGFTDTILRNAMETVRDNSDSASLPIRDIFTKLFLYAQFPNNKGGADVTTLEIGQANRPTWDPGGVRIWQYGLKAWTFSTAVGDVQVDLDLADDDGFHSMWKVEKRNGPLTRPLIGPDVGERTQAQSTDSVTGRSVFDNKARPSPDEIYTDGDDPGQ